MKSEYAANLVLSEGATPSTSWMKPPRQSCGKSWIWKWLRLRDDLKGG